MRSLPFIRRYERHLGIALQLVKTYNSMWSTYRSYIEKIREFLNGGDYGDEIKRILEINKPKHNTYKYGTYKDTRMDDEMFTLLGRAVRARSRVEASTNIVENENYKNYLYYLNIVWKKRPSKRQIKRFISLAHKLKIAPREQS